jgi:adenosylcobinamide kinase/adenosylcobinamide-phosphate guanylyltransferase
MRPDARIALIGGGARSGKSTFALARAEMLGQERVFIATAQAFDDEMRARIAAHRLERVGRYRTLEAPRELSAAIAGLGDDVEVVVIDCLTLWLSNLLLADTSANDIAAKVEGLIEELQRRRFHVLMVTNEVGMGIVPDNALSRAFRDIAGRAHQSLARACGEVYFAVLGQMLRIKPAPIVNASWGD